MFFRKTNLNCIRLILALNKVNFRLNFCFSSKMAFQGTIDNYKGITVDLGDGEFNDKTYDESMFATRLKDSLAQWKEQKLRVSWFKIPLVQSRYIPSLVLEGFNYHHAKTQYAMMYKWLSDEEPNNVPSYAYTNIGVGGIVVDDQDRVLVIKEKHFFKTQMWKYPGGYADQGEEFFKTAEREIQEETGIKCKFESIIVIRHLHKFSFGCSDIYIVCHLKPVSSNLQSLDDQLKIDKCVHEIDDCKWIPINELKPQLSSFNAFVLDKYIENRKNNIKITYKFFDTPILNLKQTAYSATFQSSDEK